MATYGLPHWPYADTAPEDLPPPERLLLDAGRAWIGAGDNPAMPAARLVLATESATAAARPLDGLLRAAASVGRLGWGCRCCPLVTDAEATTLLAVSLCQANARHEALAALLRWLPPLGAYPAMAAVLPLAAALRGAGLGLADPFRQPARRR